MGQVPEMIYGLIGDGRVAKHVAHYFDLLSLPYRQWSRKVHPTQDPADYLKECPVILLLVKDDAIGEFCQQHLALRQKILLHFSGSLVLEGVLGFHPLMTFTQDLYDLSDYQQIPFIIENGPYTFFDLFPQLPNPTHVLDPKLKAYYHALCVLAGNGSVLLWKKLFNDFAQKLQIPQTLAYPYMRALMRNIQTNVEQAMTGPIIRQDQLTIKNNLKALDGDPYQEVYLALKRAHEMRDKT
ncbi:MAG: DUF2520 domain-containing protein [Pseudomonadota bacterium]